MHTIHTFHTAPDSSPASQTLERRLLPMTLGDWVEVVSEPARHGQRVVVVNPLDDTALVTDDVELAATLAGSPTHLRDDLVVLGFTPDRVPVHRPGGVRHALRTSEVAWYGADRVSCWLARRLRPLWSSRAVIGAQVALAVLGLVAVAHLSRSLGDVEMRPHPWRVPIVIALGLVAVAVHELGHAVAVARHGRRVTALGLRVHLGAPTFYCDSAAALALDRRQRIAHALAGPWAEWLLTSAFAVGAVLFPAGWAGPILLRFALLNTFNVVSNLLPFGRLDGALVMSDLVAEPELPDESRRAFRRVMSGERRSGDGWRSAYAVADVSVGASLTVLSLVLWWKLFGGLITALATGGPIAQATLVVLAALLLGPLVATWMGRLRSFAIVDRLWFRVERRARVRCVRSLVTAGVVPFGSPYELGVLAGRVEIVRLWWADRLRVPHFDGLVVTPVGHVHRLDGRAADTVAGAADVRGPVRSGCTLIGRWRPWTTFVLVPSQG